MFSKQKPKVIISVSNDLSTDNRVKRTCDVLLENNFEIVLLGRILPQSLPFSPTNIAIKRFRFWFNNGPLFYANLNFRLFFFLLINKADVYLSNDLDTLLPNYLVSKWKKKPLIYDSHELFTEAPELIHRPTVKRFWEFLEEKMAPKLKYMITVNQSIADIFEKKYKIKPIVIRNVPLMLKNFDPITKEELNIPSEKKVVIIQGSGLNVDRGLEEAVEAFQFIEGAVFLVVGNGDVVPLVKEKVKKLQLEKNVLFLDKRPYSDLMRITQLADIGLAIDKPVSLNYELALPNKLFDYIQAETAIICSPLKEIKAIVEKYNIGLVIEETTPKQIADAIQYLIDNPGKLVEFKTNCIAAKQIENWENEKKKLESLLNSI